MTTFRKYLLNIHNQSIVASSLGSVDAVRNVCSHYERLFAEFNNDAIAAERALYACLTAAIAPDRKRLGGQYEAAYYQALHAIHLYLGTIVPHDMPELAIAA